MALVMALVCTVLALALGLAMLVSTDIEVMSSGAQRDGATTLYAADGALEFATDELSQIPDWSAVLSGAVGSRLVDATQRPTTELAGVIDLSVMTTRLQVQSDARNVWGANGPRWRLFAYGHLSQISPLPIPAGSPYVVVWVADDEAETDGNALIDVNGFVRVYAEALGARGSRRTIDAMIARTARPGSVRLVSWREGR